MLCLCLVSKAKSTMDEKMKCEGDELIPYFYDTCTLLRLQEKAFEENFYVSAQTFKELEEIKTSGRKDSETKAKARGLLRLFAERGGVYTIMPLNEKVYTELVALNLSADSDELIIASASITNRDTEKIVFGTDDVSCSMLAQCSGLDVELYPQTEKWEEYKGYKTGIMDETDMSEFYSHLENNRFDLLKNQYLRVVDANGDLVDIRKWNGEQHVPLYDKGIKSMAFSNKLKPRDEYQRMAIDSIMSNTFTVLSGKAGSGKTLMALASAFALIEKGAYDRIVIFSNPCKVRGAVELGYYTGSAIEKLMQNSIGNVLTTKFGDRYLVDQMIAQEKIKLISVADCRGCEVRDTEILYVTEAQNMSIDMIKLLLSRASQGCKVILDGDFDAQVDSWQYEGASNGMRRVVEVFKGEEIFGYVELPNVWRSKLAELAQKL